MHWSNEKREYNTTPQSPNHPTADDSRPRYLQDGSTGSAEGRVPYISYDSEDTDRTEERTFPRIQRHCHNQVSAEPIQGSNRIGDYMNKKESLIKIDEQIRKSSASRNTSSKQGIK